MATRTAISVDISSSFASKVEKLVLRWEPIRKEYQRLAERHLQFAVMIKDLWLEAKKLDAGSGERTHTNFMRQKLQVLIDTEDETILSRWRTIGKFADKLLPHASQLPSDRDHLYELANAAKDDKPIASWVKSKEIHPGVPVRDIRDLRRGTSRKKSTAADKRRHIIQIRFVEGTTTDAIASLLQGVMASDLVEQIRSATPGIQSSAKAMLRENFQSIEHKFPKAEKKQNAIATVKSQDKRVKVKA
jgi:hypothetical protein